MRRWKVNMSLNLQHTEPLSPWLSFFREVRRLAEKLDELEQTGIDRDGERLSR